MSRWSREIYRAGLLKLGLSAEQPGCSDSMHGKNLATCWLGGVRSTAVQARSTTDVVSRGWG